jgi:transcription initiation factor IIE alpha subunit
MIVDLHQQLENKNQEITTLKNNFNNALNALRAEYTRMIDDLKNKIEDNQ